MDGAYSNGFTEIRLKRSRILKLQFSPKQRHLKLAIDSRLDDEALTIVPQEINSLGKLFYTLVDPRQPTAKLYQK